MGMGYVALIAKGRLPWLCEGAIVTGTLLQIGTACPTQAGATSHLHTETMVTSQWFHATPYATTATIVNSHYMPQQPLLQASLCVQILQALSAPARIAAV